MTTRVLMTGAAGLIGSHLTEHLLKNTDWELCLMVRVGGSGAMRRLADISVWPYLQNRVTVVWHDLRSPINKSLAREIGKVDHILHLAALTDVNASIDDPLPFVESNVLGSMHALEFARTQEKLRWYVQWSTDEVFGPAPEGIYYKEGDAYNATNIYSATKAGAEQLANAYANCYGVPVLIANCMNAFGERSSLQKFIPMCLRKVILGERVTIHADPTLTKPGSRFYIHARNIAAAILFLLDRAPKTSRLAERYNVRGEKEIDNLALAKTIAEIAGRPLQHEMVSWHASRPGHDLRYSLDDTKIRRLGWFPPLGFEESLRKTIEWTLAHKEWIDL